QEGGTRRFNGRQHVTNRDTRRINGQQHVTNRDTNASTADSMSSTATGQRLNSQQHVTNRDTNASTANSMSPTATPTPQQPTACHQQRQPRLKAQY
ncbi:hypothetical protein, partial [Cupriavidus oxalaticus]|uniref:hypothetical protein n=1 Tax=Cupriavidus oxalaticus TaxID=96344 RepID=UPI001E51896B